MTFFLEFHWGRANINPADGNDKLLHELQVRPDGEAINEVIYLSGDTLEWKSFSWYAFTRKTAWILEEDAWPGLWFTSIIITVQRSRF